jgi:hypothetical protein
MIESSHYVLNGRSHTASMCLDSYLYLFEFKQNKLREKQKFVHAKEIYIRKEARD